jgi:hypothetical protein
MDDAVEANATAAPAEATEPPEASEHWTAASLGDIPAVRALARDAERAIGSIFRSYDFGAGAQMRQIQDIARSATGMDGRSASVQNLSKLPPVLDQVLRSRVKALETIAGSATTNPFMADLERVNQVIRDISRTAMPNAPMLAIDQFKFWTRSPRWRRISCS